MAGCRWQVWAKAEGTAAAIVNSKSSNTLLKDILKEKGKGLWRVLTDIVTRPFLGLTAHESDRNPNS